MKRRAFVVQSVGACVGAFGWRLRAALAADPNIPYYILPSTSHLSVRVGNCDALKAEIQRIRLTLEYERKNWAEAGEAYRRRVTTRLTEVNSALAKSQKTEKETERRLYIATTAFAVGWLVAGIGVAFASPIVVGLAVGAQILIAPVSLAVHSIMRTNDDQPAMAASILRDRVFLVGAASGESVRATTSRVFVRLLPAVQLSMSAWDLYSIRAKHKDAERLAKRARQEITEIESLISRLRTSNVRWGDFRIKSLEFTLRSLEAYVKETEQFNCLLAPRENLPSIVPG